MNTRRNDPKRSQWGRNQESYGDLGGGPLGLDLDIEKDWLNMTDESEIIEQQPFWFKYLINKNDRYDSDAREQSRRTEESSIR